MASCFTFISPRSLEAFKRLGFEESDMKYTYMKDIKRMGVPQ